MSEQNGKISDRFLREAFLPFIFWKNMTFKKNPVK